MDAPAPEMAGVAERGNGIARVSLTERLDHDAFHSNRLRLLLASQSVRRGHYGQAWRVEDERFKLDGVTYESGDTIRGAHMFPSDLLWRYRAVSRYGSRTLGGTMGQHPIEQEDPDPWPEPVAGRGRGQYS